MIVPPDTIISPLESLSLYRPRQPQHWGSTGDLENLTLTGIGIDALTPSSRCIDIDISTIDGHQDLPSVPSVDFSTYVVPLSIIRSPDA